MNTTATMTTSWRRSLRSLAVGATLALALSGCAATTVAPETGATTDPGASASAQSLWDTSVVHTISIDADPEAITANIQNFLDTGDKDWMSATVTIDGVAYENVGIKLRGNSSLRGVSLDTAREILPWRIRLDKFVDGQNADGVTDFTLRGNPTESSLNEAVALQLLGEAGLATEKTAATRFSVNDSDQALRLGVETIKGGQWLEANFPDAGADSIIYKIESNDGWEFAGYDADYSETFEIEYGDDDYTPLIELLELLSTGTDQQLADELPSLLDIASFTRYLAFEETIDNFDDIAGPGANGYLFWNSDTAQFTVVAWDHDLSFGEMASGVDGSMGGAPGQPGGQMPEGGMPEGMPGGMPEGGMPEGAPAPPSGGFGGERPEPPTGQNGGGRPGGNFGGGEFGGGPGGQGGPGGMMNRDQPLVNAIENNAEWSAMLDQQRAQLQELFFTDGLLQAAVEHWESLLLDGATDLVDAATIQSEAAKILSYAPRG